MKKTVSFGMKIPVPGVAYSNMESFITLEADDGDPEFDNLDKTALKFLCAQMDNLVKEANEIVKN